MTIRITSDTLNSIAARINEELGTPKDYWKDQLNRITSIHHYHIDKAYSGYSLHRTSNTSGGAVDIFNCGHIPARSLCELMRAYLAGLQDRKILKR